MEALPDHHVMLEVQHDETFTNLRKKLREASALISAEAEALRREGAATSSE
ncbi:hypothetical protein [Streptomyces sp. NPDC058623]|uniref:hypothetical protein n=1 Tax=Streptomyces sp. NPDC058623 TaxID=3346563 RepID=UPI0036695E77